MKFLYHIVHVWVAICVNVQCVQEIKKELTAVTSYPELEDLFPKLHEQKPAHNEAEPTLDAAAKEEICQHISSSGFFFMNARHPYSPHSKHDKATSKKKSLLIHHPIIFSHLYKLVKEENNHQLLPHYRYLEVNESKDRKVFARDHPYTERVFSCLDIQNSWSEHTEEYFVSDHQYNVSENPADFIAGRFVFWYDPQDKRIELAALAEEPATVKSDGAKSLYASLKDRDHPHSLIETAEEDPLCSLTKGQKVRLCSSVMSGIAKQSSAITHAMFFPSLNNMSSNCRLRMVTIDVPCTQCRHLEWMISCNGRDGSIYHLFQGYYRDRIFIAQTALNEKKETRTSVLFYATRLATFE